MEHILAQAFGQDAEHLAGEEKQRLLSRLLARLAHEIRNPLSSLNIHVQLLEEDLAPLPSPTRDQLAARLEIIHGELHRMENIVKHFLRLARPSELDLEPVDPAELVKRVCGLLQPEAAAQQTSLTTCLREPLPTLMADPGQLNQALVNLVINALQAVGKDGRVEVVVFMAEPEQEVAIEVHDTGPGVPAEHFETVFEPYFTTKQEGSGLGLWIARQIATAHRGTLRVSKDPLGGAIFTFRIPAPGKDTPRG